MEPTRPDSLSASAALLAAALLAPPVLSAGQALPAPDLGSYASASCGVPPSACYAAVPRMTMRDPLAPESRRRCLELGRIEGKRQTLAHRALLDVQTAGWDISIRLHECGFWPAWREFDAAGGAAAREESEEALNFMRASWTVDWRTQSEDKLESEFASVTLPPGPFDGACRAPEPEGPLFVPSSQALGDKAGARLAGIEKAALSVEKDLARQHAALVSLLPLTQGRRCREILSAYRRLVAGERAAYFAYREREVAAAVWDGLTWKPAGGASAAPR